ncbi:CheR family methyltransferase [Sulfitobacter sp. MF3-043]|uniref:CheR family methyltransferase n=1 Tax=Sulfitobacter sediminivivens TaxID=3252902 RepID=UPI0036DE0CA2
MTKPHAELDKVSFRAIADLAYRESGLTLVDEKTTMIQSRLRRRLQALKMSEFSDYCSFVCSEGGRSERKQLISALTTNVSHFFREDHHFDALCASVRASLSLLRAGGRLRIWSAGCSNGQEAVSAAIRLLETCPEIASYDLRILATDIDTEVVSFARRGCYPKRFTTGIAPGIMTRFFDPGPEMDGEETFATKDCVKRLIRFNELNLLDSWPMQGRFDAIFCRNVVIYFDFETQTRLWPRFREALTPDGLLFLGHSERIGDPAAFGFECSGPTSYRRKAG